MSGGAYSRSFNTVFVLTNKKNNGVAKCFHVVTLQQNDFMCVANTRYNTVAVCVHVMSIHVIIIMAGKSNL